MLDLSIFNVFKRKINKRSWILYECLHRVSPNIDTTKYLIEFGLRGTDLDSLAAIKDNDDNRLVESVFLKNLILQCRRYKLEDVRVLV